MRVVIVVQNYPPEIGPVTYSKDTAYALAALKHDVFIITGLPHYPNGKLYKGFEKFKLYKTIEDGVTVFRIPLVLASNNQPIKRIFGFFSFIITSLPFCLSIKKTDVFIISVPPFTTTAIGIIIRLLRRKPVIMMLRDFEPVYSLNLRLIKENKFFTKVAYFFSKLYRFYSALVITHPQQIRHLETAGLTDLRCKVITHSINLEEFDKLSFKKTNIFLNRKSDKLNAIYIGTMGKVHALTSLIENLICDEISSMPIEFYFFGSGEEKESCINIVQASGKMNVKFFEPVAAELVPALLKKADILILSFNSFDGIGLKSYSYFASGKPILFYGNGLLKDLLHSIKAGWSSDLGNKEMLIKIISDIIKRKDELVFIGQNGRKYAEANFNFKDFKNQWNDIISQVVKLKE